MKLKSVLTIAILLGMAQITQASAIVGVSGGGATPTGINPPLSGALTTPAVILYGGDANPIGDAVGSVAFGVTAFSKSGPFDISLGVFDTAGIGLDAIAARTINFAVTVTNMVGTGVTIPGEPAAAGDDIQNIEFEIVTAGGPAHAFIPASAGGVGGAAPLTPLLYINGSGNQVLRFGGVNGGGPAISNGGSQVFNFQIATLASNTPFSLRITANPEPGSIILALIVAMSFGGYYYYQRNKQQLPEAVAMVA